MNNNIMICIYIAGSIDKQMDGLMARWRYEREKEQLLHRQQVMGLGFIYKHMLRQDC